MNINREKMITLKVMVLSKMLPSKEVKKLYGCDYEFTIEENKIVMLEVWHNPKGEHKYEDKFRKCFKIKPVSVDIICE
jgi:hypothetical protein